MSVTYSIKIGTPYEAKRLINIEDVLRQLPDNTNKEISPKDVRDAFLSTWANSPFKLTKPVGTNTEYIGIDSGNPAGRDIKEKMYFGKRQYLGKDIMNDTLLKSDTDIFFYNTRLDSGTQSTKISILSGTDSKLFQYAPYIESQSNGLRTDLIIRNPSTYSSNINIESTTGRVSINGISFPTIDENKNGADGKVLRYQGTFPNGYLKWDTTNIDNLNIGTSASKIELYGGTVSLNGFELEFYDPRPVPKKIGGVEAGMSFSKYSDKKTKWPLNEVLRKLLYTYVPPELKISVYNKVTGLPYFERGVATNIGITYSVSVYSIGLFTNNYISATGGGFISNGSKSSQGIAIINNSNLVSPSASTPGYNKISEIDYAQSTSNVINSYYLYVDDSNNTLISKGFSHSASASMYPIYPIYFGFTSSIITSFSGMTSSLNKLVIPSPGNGSSIYYDYKGSGYLYFCYPIDSVDSKGNKILFGTPSTILDAQSLGIKYYDSKSPSLSIFTYSATYSNSIGTYSWWRTKDIVSYTELNKLEFKF